MVQTVHGIRVRLDWMSQENSIILEKITESRYWTPGPLSASLTMSSKGLATDWTSALGGNPGWDRKPGSSSGRAGLATGVEGDSVSDRAPTSVSERGAGPLDHYFMEQCFCRMENSNSDQLIRNNRDRVHCHLGVKCGCCKRKYFPMCARPNQLIMAPLSHPVWGCDGVCVCV